MINSELYRYLDQLVQLSCFVVICVSSSEIWQVPMVSYQWVCEGMQKTTTIRHQNPWSFVTPSLTFSFQDGQLGFGGRSRRFNARPVARLGAAVDIRAGGSHTCALEVGERSSGITMINMLRDYNSHSSQGVSNLEIWDDLGVVYRCL